MKRFLRSPTIIVGEIAALAVAGVVGATLPQAGAASSFDLARLRLHGPVFTAFVHVFALDHVFRSLWFVALTTLTTASLSIVVAEQLRRVRVTWSQRPTEAQLHSAPFCAEFERRPRRAATDGGGGTRVELRTTGRLGLAGSLVFHVGLLLVIVAGVLHALFAVDAAVDVIEGETVPPSPEAWAAQWPGMLARPFKLDAPVTVDAIRATRYERGALRDLTLGLSVQQGSASKQEQIGVNRELRLPGGRVLVGFDFGPAALLEWRESGGSPVREALLLVTRGRGVYEAAAAGPRGTTLFVRADVDRAGARPDNLEVRIVRVAGDGRLPLVFAGVVPLGAEVTLPGGNVLKLHGLPFWARLRGNRDPALWLAYVGFAVVLAGATIMFTVVKIDACVLVTAHGERERVFVALRPQRFAPLFQERFARMVREEGGSA